MRDCLSCVHLLILQLISARALAAAVAVAPIAAARADDAQGVASSRMSYSRFLEYLDMGRVKKVRPVTHCLTRLSLLKHSQLACRSQEVAPFQNLMPVHCSSSPALLWVQPSDNLTGSFACGLVAAEMQHQIWEPTQPAVIAEYEGQACL